MDNFNYDYRKMLWQTKNYKILAIDYWYSFLDVISIKCLRTC